MGQPSLGHIQGRAPAPLDGFLQARPVQPSQESSGTARSLRVIGCTRTVSCKGVDEEPLIGPRVGQADRGFAMMRARTPNEQEVLDDDIRETLRAEGAARQQRNGKLKGAD